MKEHPNLLSVLIFKVKKDHPSRLDHVLAILASHLSRTFIKKHIEEGHVYVNDLLCYKPSHKVLDNDSIKLIPIKNSFSPLKPYALDLNIVYEDDFLLVINKPAGLVVHPGAGTRDITLVNALLNHCKGSLSGINGVEKPGIVHRLDKNTSGLLVVAKDDKTHRALSAQFAHRSLKRVYTAFVWGCPIPVKGVIEGNISRSPRERKKMHISKEGGRRAITHYCVLETYKGDCKAQISKVLCQLETGRTHQIRLHFEFKGYPLIGDSVYGKRDLKSHALLKNAPERLLSCLQGRQALHAHRLSFIHPQGELMVFDAPLAADLQELENFLKNNTLF